MNSTSFPKITLPNHTMRWCESCTIPDVLLLTVVYIYYTFSVPTDNHAVWVVHMPGIMCLLISNSHYWLWILFSHDSCGCHNNESMTTRESRLLGDKVLVKFLATKIKLLINPTHNHCCPFQVDIISISQVCTNSMLAILER